MRLDEFLGKGYSLEVGDEIQHEAESRVTEINPYNVKANNNLSTDDKEWIVVKAMQLQPKPDTNTIHIIQIIKHPNERIVYGLCKEGKVYYTNECNQWVLLIDTVLVVDK